jgi:hypothetical protein
MAAPNLRAPTTITGKTAGYACTTTLASALANGASSGKVLKVNTIRAANIDNAAAFTVDVSLFRGGVHRYIAKDVSIAAASTAVLVTKEEYFYLEEDDAIYARCPTASKIDLTITYEDIS